ncbi:hypothetical protein [Amycolatopsis antarctica]|uniref:hypothetical protein n=1 Tax=Amycolatopsis antarctica TaxID=1854586 RepID=UPI0013FDE74D|nr:hypothetical protein [Amycolatopsis antarctica]
MMTENRRTSTTHGKWAPWWVYVVVLVGANWLRAGLLPGDQFPLVVTVAITVGQAAVLFALITVIHRAFSRSA